MKAFLKNLILFLITLLPVVAALTALLFAGIAPQFEQSYNAAIIDKMARLRSLDSPKLVLVGDSNLAYGTDSAILEERFGLPVVNLALHGGLGNQFHERMLQGELGEGDIIVLCHTSYGDGTNIDTELAWITIEDHFDLWPIVPPDARGEMLKTLPKYAVRCARLFITGTGNQETSDSYRRSAFNVYGDVAVERPDGIHEKTGAQHTGLLHYSETGIRHLNELTAACEAAGASLYVTAYPVMDDGHAPAPEKFRAVTDAMQEELSCRIISDFEDYYFPPEMFFNTAYHMTSNGAHLRSLQLADDLARALSAD